MVGTVYLVTVLILAALIGIASRQHHTSTADVDMFRFPPILISALRIGVALPPLVGYGIYKSFGRPLAIYEDAFLSLFFGSITLILAAQLWVTSQYLLKIQGGRITVHDWRGRRSTPIEEIAKVEVSHPWRGRGYMDLFNTGGNHVVRIDAGLQDFEELADSIINQCGCGTIVREKRPGDKWVQRAL